MPAMDPQDWYEAIPFADGITLIQEPWMPFFFRCNMWLVEGRERTLLVDAGLGVAPLRPFLQRLGKNPTSLFVSHTHFDHIGAAHEFEERLVHPAEAVTLAEPAPDATLFGKYAQGGRDAEMFIVPPQGWEASRYAITPAPATGMLQHGERIDLGGRVLTVLHTPGHSPGHLSLFEERTGTLIAQDAIYDGPLVDDLHHSDIPAYVQTMQALRELQPRIVHGGHFPSFGPTRYRQIIDAYIAEKGGGRGAG